MFDRGDLTGSCDTADQSQMLFCKDKLQRASQMPVFATNRVRLHSPGEHNPRSSGAKRMQDSSAKERDLLEQFSERWLPEEAT
jgi:hypothetical protein